MESLFQKNKRTNRFSSSAELHSWIFLKQISSVKFSQRKRPIKRRAQYVCSRPFFLYFALKKTCITRVCSNRACVIRKPQLTIKFVAGHAFYFNQQHKIFESYRCLSVLTNGSVTKNSKSAHWSQSLRLGDRTKRVLHQSLGNAVLQHLLVLQHKQRNVPSVRCL
jgi:hypothetical protein